ALARALRLHIVPWVIPALFAFRPLRRVMFRTVSQASVHYRGSALSQGRAGRIQGGDRLPWVPPAAPDGDRDNFEPLASLDWQVQVYGDAARGLDDVCRQRHVPLHVFPWRPQMRATGLQRNGVYLVRPDGYVGLADPGNDGAAIESYLDARRLTVGRP